MRDTNYLQGEEKAIFDACWQWVLDHSDISADGQLFIKAHIASKDKFRKCIKGRMRGIYRNIFDEETIENRRTEALNKQIKNNLAKVAIIN